MRKNKNSTPQESLESILLKMKYDSKKTLTENKQSITEQMGGVWAGTPGAPANPPTEAPEEYNPEEYPNYCKYPNMAVKVDEGEATGYQGYCRYARPEQNVSSSEKVGIWIPQNATISFTNPTDWKATADYLAKKFPLSPTATEQEKNAYRDLLFNNMRDILPVDTVFKFQLSNDSEEYKCIITQQKDKTWHFTGYYLGGIKGSGPWYEEPTDSRNAYQKFADNFSWWKQILAFVGLAILTRGLSARYGLSAAQAWIMESLFSVVGIGGVVGVREFQKGNNVSGVLTFLLSGIPLLRGSTAFRGVKPEVFNSLADDLSKVTLETSDDVMKFYKELAESGPLGLEKQRLFTQIFNGGDDLTKELIEKTIKEFVENPKALVNLAAKTVGQTPEQFWRISFLKSVMAKELGWAGFIAVLGLGVEVFLGRQLNDEEKMVLASVYRTIPESHKKEFEYNLANHPEKVPEVVERFKTQLPEKGKHFDSTISKVVNTHMKDIIGPEEYIEFQEDPEKGDTLETEIADTPKNIKKYTDLGYKQYKDFNEDEEISNETIFIGTKLFIKPKKK
jgi:hypothetical protein